MEDAQKLDAQELCTQELYAEELDANVRSRYQRRCRSQRWAGASNLQGECQLSSSALNRAGEQKSKENMQGGVSAAWM